VSTLFRRCRVAGDTKVYAQGEDTGPGKALGSRAPQERRALVALLPWRANSGRGESRFRAPEPLLLGKNGFNCDAVSSATAWGGNHAVAATKSPLFLALRRVEWWSRGVAYLPVPTPVGACVPNHWTKREIMSPQRRQERDVTLSSRSGTGGSAPLRPPPPKGLISPRPGVGRPQI